MWHNSTQTLIRPAVALVLALGTSSCSLITFDCGGPTTREASAFATMRDQGDTISVDGYASTWEERQRDGTYTHQLMIGIQATNAAHYDTIPSALRPHVTGARLELNPGNVLFHVAMSNNTSQRYGPPVVALIADNAVNQALFDSIRRLMINGAVTLIIETDSDAVRFAPASLVPKTSRDWTKSSGCK
jgi:hypothetical protein